MTRFSLCLALLLPLAATGCGQMSNLIGAAPGTGREAGRADAPPPAPEEIRAIVSAPPPQAAARTADQFDTVTEAQKAAATAAPTGSEERLGEVIASLGDPSEPGLWIKTPLVSAQRSGRLDYPVSGKSAVVELRPLEGGGGSQVSLAAMRLLEAPLTELPTLVVYGN